jgi:hypothetical protein
LLRWAAFKGVKFWYTVYVVHAWRMYCKQQRVSHGVHKSVEQRVSDGVHETVGGATGE